MQWCPSVRVGVVDPSLQRPPHRFARGPHFPPRGAARRRRRGDAGALGAPAGSKHESAAAQRSARRVRRPCFFFVVHVFLGSYEAQSVESPFEMDVVGEISGEIYVATGP